MSWCSIFVLSDSLSVTATVSGLGTVATDLNNSVAGSKCVMVVGGVGAIPTRMAVDLSMAIFAQLVFTTF